MLNFGRVADTVRGGREGDRGHGSGGCDGIELGYWRGIGGWGEGLVNDDGRRLGWDEMEGWDSRKWVFALPYI